MKRFFSVILMVAIVLLSLSACDNSNNETGATTEKVPNINVEEAKKELTLLSNEFMDVFLPYVYYGENKSEVDDFMASSYSIDNAGLTIFNSMLKEQCTSQLSDWIIGLLEVAGEECTQEWIDETLQVCVYESLLDAAINKSEYSIDSINVVENGAEVSISVDIADSCSFSTEGMQIDPLLMMTDTKQMVRNAFNGLDYDNMVVMGTKILTIKFVQENGEWKIDQVIF